MDQQPMAAPDGGEDARMRTMQEELKLIMGDMYQPRFEIGSGKMHENGFIDMPRDMRTAAKSMGNKKVG